MSNRTAGYVVGPVHTLARTNRQPLQSTRHHHRRRCHQRPATIRNRPAKLTNRREQQGRRLRETPRVHSTKKHCRGQNEEDLRQPNKRESHGMITPRRHLQEEHDVEALLPPDLGILYFHPENVKGPSTTTTMPSGRERRPRTPIVAKEGRGFPR
jgi:hypothetical protein